MMIQPIVEGHGDVEAVPVLLRRFVNLTQHFNVRIGQPIRRPRNKLVKQSELEKAIVLARKFSPDAILVLFDGDRDCPATLGPVVQAWADGMAGGIPCQVVMAHREYEAWFLAAIESLRGSRGIRRDAPLHPDPEIPRGAKERLEERMHPGRSYMETIDQPAFSARFSMAAAHAGCRSFRKMMSAFGALLHATGHDIHPWPPNAERMEQF